MSNNSELHLQEGRSATADLLGEVTTNLIAKPEPSTVILDCTAVPMGLLLAWRRRKANSAA